MLADIFEKFRNRCLENYSLCPSHCLIALALIWDAIFNITKVKLDLISYVEMHLFFEQGMGGGVSYTSKRYSKAKRNT